MTRLDSCQPLLNELERQRQIEAAHIAALDAKPKIDWRKAKRDMRPQKNWWAPGDYIRVCNTCKCGFIGDKRAGTCADCAYTPAAPPESPLATCASYHEREAARCAELLAAAVDDNNEPLARHLEAERDRHVVWARAAREAA